jgi:hypothetical protein
MTKPSIGFRTDPNVLKEVDLRASASGLTRSEWLNQIVADAIGKPLPISLVGLSRRIEALEKKLGSLAS